MNDEHKELFAKYLEDEKVRGHHGQGLKGLKTRVPKLFVYLEDMSLDYRKVKINEAQNYQTWLIQTGRHDGNKYNMSTISSYVYSALSFFNFLKREKHIITNPFSEIKKVRGDFKLPGNILKEKEVDILLNELSNYDREKRLTNKITAYKVYVASELMYSTGLRISEVAGLHVSDIDFDRGIVNVVDGKGGRNGVCFLNEYIKNILKIYVDEMRELIFNKWNNKNGNLFGAGYECFGRYVNKYLNKTAKKLGFRGVTSHTFRHCVGYHLLRSGCDIRYIQAILGHKRLKSTEIYTKVDKDDLKEVLEQYHPRQFKEIK